MSTNENETSYDRAWDIHCYAEKILSDRMNYGMVAQTMLLLSFITIFVDHKPHFLYLVLEIAICSLGVIYSYFQYSRIFSVSQRIIHLQEKYLKNDDVFAAYMGAFSSRKFAVRIRTHVIPMALIALWLVLYLTSLLNHILACCLSA